MTTATRSSSLPLAAVLADLREQLAAASGHAARLLALDIKWAELDRARALADPDARRLAERLADEGDEDARAALRLAAKHKPLPAAASVGVAGADRNVGSALSGAPAVPRGLLDRLAAARRRGEPFDIAWGAALAALGATAGPWGEVLRCTRAAWRASYLHEPAPRGFNVLSWDDVDPSEAPARIRT